MRRRSVAALVLFVCAIPTLGGRAAEPVGRVAFHYAWVGERDSVEGRRLRLSVQALVPLEDARLEASAPSGADKLLPRWAGADLALGSFVAGAATVVEIDVVEPTKGGEILTLSLRALERGVPVTEVVGIPVGTPGATPTVRNGAVEFPAVRDEPRP